MIRLLLYVFIASLIPATVIGQAGIIRGTVQDSITQTVVEGADVFLFAQGSGKLVLKTRTHSKGFTLRQVPEGPLYLVVAAMGFVNDTAYLRVQKNDSVQVAILLHAQEHVLDDIVVSASPKPVVAKGDTLTFNADAFVVRPNSQMEDLLRKLPGVDVDAEGNVTVYGQRVDKVLLNGREFFIGDIKTANGLPAEMIAAIETFTTLSDKAKFTGVKEPGETRTLNIKTRKGMEDAWIGNVYGGKAKQKSYAAGGQLTRLGTDVMLSATLKTNNINNRFIGLESKSPGPQSGVQTNTDVDINLMKKWSNKFNTNFSLKGNNQKAEMLQSTSRRSFFTDSSLQENRQSQSVTQNNNYPAQLLFTYDANSRNQWQLSTGVSVVRQSGSNQDTAATQTLYNNNTGYTGNRTQTHNQSSSRTFSINNKLDWRHRFGRAGQTLQLSFMQGTQAGNSPGSLFSIVNSFAPNGVLLQQNIINQRYTQSSKGNSYGGSVMYTQPLAAQHNLSVSYSFNTEKQWNDKRSDDYDSSTGGYDQPNLLTSNSFTNRNATHKVEGIVSRALPRLNYQIGLGWQHSTLDNRSVMPDRLIVQQFTNLFPRASANIRLSKGRTIDFSYVGNSISPGIEQLQPLPDLTNPLFIKTGNPGLRQAFFHNVSAGYRSVSSKNYNSTGFSLFGNIIRNQIVSSVTLLPGGVQQLQYINVNGSYLVGVSSSNNFGLSGKNGQKNSVHIVSRLRHGREAAMINGLQSFAAIYTWEEIVRLNYNIGTRLIADFSAITNVSGYRYSVNPQQNTQSFTANVTVNASYELPMGFYVQGGVILNHMNTAGLLPSQTNCMLNASVYKRLFAKQQWQIRISGFDLLNSNRNLVQSASQNYIYTSQTNQLQRMFLFSLIYNFKIFPHLKNGGLQLAR